MSLPRILCVDDDPNVLAGFHRTLRNQFHVEIAPGGREALDKLIAGPPFAVILADMKMPEMTGIELLSTVAQQFPDTVRIMLTGDAEQRTASDAVNQGRVFGFLNKPCPPQALIDTLQRGVQQHQLILAERQLLENTLAGAIQVLVEILAIVDPAAFGLGQRLRESVQRYLQFLKLGSRWELEVAALLSQIGYVTIPPSVIRSVRAGLTLSPTEEEMVTRVPQIGADLLASIPRLETVSKIILYQHKNFDGTGFPRDAVGSKDLPLGARILHPLTDLEELLSRGFSIGSALIALQERTGRYDPKILETIVLLHHGHPPTANSLAVQVRFVRERDLQPGFTLAGQIETLDGLLIVPAGQKLTSTTLDKVRNFAKVSGLREPIAVEVPLPPHDSVPISPGGDLTLSA